MQFPHWFQIRSIFLLASSLLAIQGKEPTIKPALNQAGARKMLVEYLNAKDAEKKATLKAKLLVLPENDRKVFAAAFAEGNPINLPARTKKTALRLTERIPLEGAEQPEGEFLIFIPKKYSEKTPMPLVFDLHGTGDNASDYSRHWQENPLADDFFVIVPTIPSKEKKGWRDQGCRAFIDKIFRHMLEKYAIDTDRVYVAGFSAGGAAAFYYPQSWPHRFAGFLSRGRVWWNYDENRDGCMAVLRYVPGFFLIGLNDKPDRVEGYQIVEKYYKARKFQGLFHFAKGREHEYMAEFDREAYGFLLKQKRVRYPKSFEAFFFMHADERPEEHLLTRQYWIEARKYSYTGVECRVEAEGNKIDIQAKGLKAATLYLNDSIVDLDQPVIVNFNGEQVFQGKVERSMEYLLEDFEHRLDPKLVYWNKLDIGG